MNVRLRYEKLGLMQFLSHLEVMKTWEQLFRRENIPMLYSEGFNPKPKMNFALPLAVGIQAVNDYLEIEVEDGFDTDRFLVMEMPPGLRVTGAKPVEGKPLMAVVASADFKITGDLMPFAEGLEREQLLFQKHTKKGERTRDAKPMIIEYQLTSDELWVHLKAGSVSNLKPTDLLIAMLDDPDKVYDYDIVRVDVYDETGRSLWLR
ncbi:MAG: DUF2344 domain-containing protein [Tissierellia bacterium]|nr:DUF2344 domain-containing protein [Tissierellia bacterium]